MIRVAIVEDEKPIADLLNSYMKNYGDANQVTFISSYFSNAEDLLCSETHLYDLILLDIQLPGINGMDAAVKIRKMNPEVTLIFVTSLAQYALKGYEVNALDFLVKPVTYAQFSMRLNKAVRVINRKDTMKLTLPSETGKKVVSTKSVLYLEVYGHNLVYHTEEGNYRIRGSISAAVKTLENYHFVQISNSFAINLQYISMINGNEITLSNGEQLFISRTYKKSVMATFAKYLGGNI